MPELPEIVLRAREVDAALSGRVLADAELSQPKCLNLPPEEFRRALQGQTVRGACSRGKWIVVTLCDYVLYLSLGMGGDLLLLAPEAPVPPKQQAVLTFRDGWRLAVHFWWFGHLELVACDRLRDAAPTARLGMDALCAECTPAALAALLAGRRARLKALLLDQSLIAGIGNMYAHDILFRARLHPARIAASLSEGEVLALWQAIRDTLQAAITLGGSAYERSLHGEPGGLTLEHLLIGYKESQPCPRCQTPIDKIKTGSTSGFVCPTCQPLPA